MILLFPPSTVLKDLEIICHTQLYPERYLGLLLLSLLIFDLGGGKSLQAPSLTEILGMEVYLHSGTSLLVKNPPNPNHQGLATRTQNQVHQLPVGFLAAWLGFSKPVVGWVWCGFTELISSQNHSISVLEPNNIAKLKKIAR